MGKMSEATNNYWQKFLIVTVICLFLFGCTSNEKNRTDLSFQQEKVIDEVVIQQHQKSTCDETCKGTVLVNLSQEISFHWSNETHEIVEDQLFLKAEKQFSKNYSSVLEDIMDTNVTSAIECTKHKQLVVGDLAFLFIDKVKNIPYFSVLETQLDALTYGCKYPVSLFDYLARNRYEAKNKLKNYLENNE